MTAPEVEPHSPLDRLRIFTVMIIYNRWIKHSFDLFWIPLMKPKDRICRG